MVLLLNGFGGAPPLELHVMVDAVQKVPAGSGVKVGVVFDRVVRHVAEDGGLLDHDHRSVPCRAGAGGCAGAYGGVAWGM